MRQFAGSSRGQLIAAFGMIVLSFDALLIRLADTAPANASFWRGALIAFSLCAYLTLTGATQEFRLLRQHWQSTAIICGLYGINTLMFVFSISYTKVANTVIILSCTPLFSALFSWWMLKERPGNHTSLAMLFAVAGVGIVFADAADFSGWVGNALALVLAISTALMLTYLRGKSEFPRVSAVAVSGLISALLVLPFASPLAVSGTSLIWLAIMGLIQMPVASVCMFVATRYITSPQVSLFLLLETVLAPVWVWIAVNETLSVYALFGATVVIVTIAAHSYYEMKCVTEGA